MRFFQAALFVVLLSSTAVQAQMITKLTPENIGATLAANNLRFIETTDNRGFPLIQIETQDRFSAANINVFFYGCDTNGCEDITLWSWYQPSERVTDERLHEWNDVFRHARNWSRAYIDEDRDPVLAMNINATGGIGPDALQILVNTYLIEAQDFGHFIGADIQRY